MEFEFQSNLTIGFIFNSKEMRCKLVVKVLKSTHEYGDENI